MWKIKTLSWPDISWSLARFGQSRCRTISALQGNTAIRKQRTGKLCDLFHHVHLSEASGLSSEILATVFSMVNIVIYMAKMVRVSLRIWAVPIIHPKGVCILHNDLENIYIWPQNHISETPWRDFPCIYSQATNTFPVQSLLLCLKDIYGTGLNSANCTNETHHLLLVILLKFNSEDQWILSLSLAP